NPSRGWVRAAEDAEPAAPRRRDERGQSGAVDQRAAEALEKSVRTDQLRRPSRGRGEYAGSPGPERGGEGHRAVVVDGGEWRQVAEQVARLGDPRERPAAARVDALAAPAEVGPERHGAPSIDDGEPVEGAEGASGVRDGGDRLAVPGEDAGA